MWQRILSFFMAIVAFFMQLLGLNGKKTYSEFRDISYGSDVNQTVDLVLPTNVGSETSLFVYIHGGSWVAGDKEEGRNLTTYCASDLKLAAASLNYRLLTEGGSVHCSEMLDDITAGIKAAVAKAREQGVTIKDVAIGGNSAGGHLTLLYAYSRADESPVPIKFIFDEVGPSDFSGRTFIDACTGMDRSTALLILSELSGITVTDENIESDGVQKVLRAISPVTYVNASSVPTVMAYGMKDELVTYENALSLDRALTEAGVTHDFFTFPNSGHNLDADEDVRKAFNDKLLEYMQTYLTR